MNNNIDWKEVEEKISLICYKFSNLEPWHEDLAQELRIHAYYVSDNYYDLYRKAIDFWRKIQTRQSPETPYFDLELIGGQYDVDQEVTDQFEDMVTLIKKELNSTPQNKWEKNKMDLAQQLLDIILSDIDPESSNKVEIHKQSTLNHYINNRLNLSWASEVTGVGYKQIVAAMKLLEDIVRGLHAMHKIEIPAVYFKGYYED